MAFKRADRFSIKYHKELGLEERRKVFLKSRPDISKFLFESNIWRRMPRIMQYLKEIKSCLGYSENTSFSDILRMLKKTYDKMNKK